MKLFIVESPGKIKKLSQILGQEYRVMASIGHIRELSNEGEDALGFKFEQGHIDCKYVARSSRAKQVIAELKRAAQQASEVLLACDPDREGETISWHLSQVLGLKQPKRVVYQEITEAAVRRAIAHPRPLDLPLVAAGRCRDCLDKLVGYKGSPLVWRLNNGAKSVGRVQSATLHLVCQREREIQVFIAQDYWSVYVDYAEGFRAFYRGQPQVSSDKADDESSEAPESSRVLSQVEAERLVEIARSHPHQVVNVEGKQTRKQPPAAFTTSTLQQAAGSKLKFSPEQTMQVAQKLYEAGLITYMRTDSVQLSPEYCASARQWLESKDPDNVPEQTAKHRSTKAAQEAHEAVRPTDVFKSSAELKTQLSADEFQLYVLIWKRAIATQCKPAQILKSQIITQSGSVNWEAKGQVVQFPGYGKYWQDISADAILPTVMKGQTLGLAKAGHEQKQTQPPPRYSEPKLVQLMERKGIGRPSTYAPTIATLKERLYVNLSSGKLQPSELGMSVDAFMGQALPELLQAEFTAQMELSLDEIAEGKQPWERYLTNWNQRYFEPALEKAQKILPAVGTGNSQRQLERSKEKCPKCGHALSKVPSTKVKKKYFLKCEQGCQSEDGKDFVLFWSDFSKQWQAPAKKVEPSAETITPAKLTEYPCPVCKKPLAEISYSKDGQTKQMLKCSSEKAKSDPKHKNVVYFQSQGGWWSPKFGDPDA